MRVKTGLALSNHLHFCWVSIFSSATWKFRGLFPIRGRGGRVLCCGVSELSQTTSQEQGRQRRAASPRALWKKEVRGRGGDVASSVKASDADRKASRREDAVVTPTGPLVPLYAWRPRGGDGTPGPRSRRRRRGGGRSTPPLGSSGLQPASLFSPARETDAPALFLVSLRALSLSLSSLSCAPEVDEGGRVRGEMPRID